MLYEQEFQRFAALHKEQKRLETELKAVKSAKGKCGEQIAEIFTQLGIDKTRSDGVTIFISCQTFASIPNGNEPVAAELLQKYGYGDILKTTALPSKVAALVRELQAKDAMPEDLAAVLNIYEKTEVKGKES